MAQTSQSCLLAPSQLDLHFSDSAEYILCFGAMSWYEAAYLSLSICGDDAVRTAKHGYSKSFPFPPPIFPPQRLWVCRWQHSFFKCFCVWTWDLENLDLLARSALFWVMIYVLVKSRTICTRQICGYDKNEMTLMPHLRLTSVYYWWVRFVTVTSTPNMWESARLSPPRHILKLKNGRSLVFWSWAQISNSQVVKRNAKPNHFLKFPRFKRVNSLAEMFLLTANPSCIKQRFWQTMHAIFLV